MNQTKFTMYSLLGITIVAGIISFLLFIYAEPISKTKTLLDGTEEVEVVFNWLNFWLYAVVIYTIASYRFWGPVKTGEQAALTLFERPVANVLAGAPFAPIGFIKILPVTARTDQREFPAEPQFIDRTELKDGYVIPEHKKPPLRIQFRDSIIDDYARELFGEEGEGFYVTGADGQRIPFVAEAPIDGLSGRVTAEVQHVVRVRVNDPCRFFSNVPGGALEEAFRQIEDEMVSVITRFYTRISVAQALMNLRWMSIHLFTAVKRRVGARGDSEPWGIDVQSAFVKLIHTDHGINISISKAAQAPFDRTKTVIDADAKRQQLELEGQGTGSAARDLTKGTLVGRAEGLQDISFKLEISGEEVQAAEVARSMGENGNTFIAGLDGFGQLTGIAAATLGKNKKDKPEPTPEEGGDS